MDTSEQSILEQADKVIITPETQEKYESFHKMIGVDDDNLYALYDMFDIAKEDWLDNNIVKKIKYIYEWSNQFDDPFKAIRDVDLKLGITAFKDKLDKIYEFARISGEVRKKGMEYAQLVEKKWQYENSGNL